LLALSLLGLGLLLPGPAEGRLPDALFRRPPRARVVPHVREKHGERFVDPFFWLRQRDNPEVIRYLKAENAYTRHFMRDTEPLQETLYQEMLARIKETDFSVPRRHGPFLYYERTEQGKQHLIHCRRRDQAGGPKRSCSTRTPWRSAAPASTWARSRSAPITGSSPSRSMTRAAKRTPSR
jgi:hypothetical protein